ncbi:MAG: hypothetical protein AAF433_10645 [Bacteroidota bacterium]
MQYEYIRDGLPHFHHIGGTFAVTTQLVDAIPKTILKSVQEEYQEKLSRLRTNLSKKSESAIWQLQKEYESQFERLLNAHYQQEHLLQLPQAATIVAQRILQYNEQYYRCEAFSIMSNHIHLLLDFSLQIPPNHPKGKFLKGYKNLEEVMRLIKGGSAFQINKVIGRKGPVWRSGYYNRYIRHERHWKSAYWYILNNPVKAGLVQRWQDHPFTYAAEGSYARLSRL